MNGRLRIWCRTCGSGADTALEPGRIPFWPYGTPQQCRSCVTVSLSSEARPLLLRVQTDLLAMLVGAGPRGPWARSLKWARVSEVLRRLMFVMLGPLWEDGQRAAPVRAADGKSWQLPGDWTPGSLSPEIAAPALLAAVTFLAAESGTRLQGITWNPELLIAGENDGITAETLLWHLGAFDARLVEDLFAAPLTRPLLMLLAALRTDRHGLGPAREMARRRQGVGGARRRARQMAQLRAHETTAARAAREQREVACRPSERFALSRLIDGDKAAHAPPRPRDQWQEAVAVYTLIGWYPRDSDMFARTDWAPALLKNPYIRHWIVRHRHWAAADLIATLANAVDAADSENRGVVLPEALSDAVVSMPSVAPAGRSGTLSDPPCLPARRPRSAV